MNNNVPTTLFSQLPRLYPFTVGFDNLFDQLDLVSNQRTGFPKYNIDHYEDSVSKISFALAGYDENEISVTLENNQLVVSAKVQLESNESYTEEFGYRGIAHRSFSQKFVLSEHTEVQNATFKNGLLVITLKKIVPEHKKLKQIPINK